jgi:predicted DNA-binding transcriptional regulator AlpA
MAFMKILRLKEVLERVGLSRATWYRLVASGDAPQQVKISIRRVGWIDTGIDDFIISRKPK